MTPGPDADTRPYGLWLLCPMRGAVVRRSAVNPRFGSIQVGECASGTGFERVHGDQWPVVHRGGLAVAPGAVRADS